MKIIRELTDHFTRSLKAVAGFQVFGAAWLPLWLYYVGSPLFSRILRPQERITRLCRYRTTEGDAYTFANIFEDYPADNVRTALVGIDQVIDAGANVGAFSLLARTLSLRSGTSPRILAIEPMEDNVAILRRQPFAESIEIIHGALGPADGEVSMKRGFNSVTHHADFSSHPTEDRVRMFGLAGLCDRPTLLKMDIEGGEHAVLAAGLPHNVRSLFLEWHPIDGQSSEISPKTIIPTGKWKLVSRDLYGSSMWFWQAAD